MDWLNELDDVLNFIRTHDDCLLSNFNDDLALISKELESICYVLLSEQQDRWLTADESFLNNLYEHGLCIRKTCLNLSAKQSIKQSDSYSIDKTNLLTQSTFFDSELYREVTLDDDWTGLRMAGYSFLDEDFPCSSFKTIWLQLSERFYAEYGSSIFTEYNRVYRKSLEPHFTRKKPVFSESQKIKNTPFYAPTKKSSNAHKRIVSNLLKLTGYTIEDLKIYVKK